MNWIWILVRVTGLTAYFLLTLSLLAGILRHVPRNKGFYLSFHQIIGQVSMLFIGIHAFLLLFDQYQPYTLTEIFIPFASSYEPLLSALGTIGAYLLLIVLFTSDFMKMIGRSAWKKTHYLVFTLWLVCFLHGILMGTDSSAIWSPIFYWTTFAVIIGGTIYLGAVMIRAKKLSH
ncbi:ferric reductase-like transmembrane domain-containing protein [Fictibacillus enclensis]|uniref:ferric reductase-like transmembrane domain-containing protein n=1 Tax=Fictibacillus enclensis TaxID=1017270 RepID=UPI0025A11849|nr:ferric reductase-like transmembrane domain-containing protein [Fictibacillus enclensis]MDM5200540.1 ferric reductase-like transmembrane domain-containing protein [Fictibacillus enclensis]